MVLVDVRWESGADGCKEDKDMGLGLVVVCWSMGTGACNEGNR